MKYTLDTWQSGSARTGLSVPTAAGLLADGETVTVAAIAAEQAAGVNKGEPAPGLSLTLWENPLAHQDGEHPFVMRWTSGSLMTPDEDTAGTLQQVVERATAIARLAGKLAGGERYDGENEADEPPALDRVVDEVADALYRRASVAPDALPLLRRQALGLARAAMSRLCTIRDRDGIDPLPHRDVPATEPGYDPVTDLAVVALAAMRTAMPSNPTATTGLLRLQRNLGVDGTTAYPAVVLALRAALEASDADR